MEFHEAANIFPMDEESLPELVKDIRENGQQVPIETYDGKILDGRRRFKACKLAGVTPKFLDVNPKDPVAYVLSLNLHRRHLTPTQLAMVGARARKLYDKRAKERQKEHGRTAPGRKKSLPVNLPEVNGCDARDDVGKSVGVSGKSIDHATRVLNSGTPELIAAVDADKVAVSTAARAATFSEAEQNALVERATSGRKRKPRPNEEETTETTEQPRKPGTYLGVGVIRAHEAINCLKEIPPDDKLRKAGFRVVLDYIKHNS